MLLVFPYMFTPQTLEVKALKYVAQNTACKSKSRVVNRYTY